MTKSPTIPAAGRSGRGADQHDIATATAFSERVAEIYAAPPLTEARRRAFDAALMERVEASDSSSRRTRPRLGFALAPIAAAAAVLLLLLWIGPAEETTQQPLDAGDQRVIAHLPIDRQVDGRMDTATATPRVGSLEESMIAVATGPVSDSSEGLPADYAAIDSLFFGS